MMIAKFVIEQAAGVTIVFALAGPCRVTATTEAFRRIAALSYGGLQQSRRCSCLWLPF